MADSSSLLASSTLLRGRNSVVDPHQGLDRAVVGTLLPVSAPEDASTVEVNLCRTASELSRTLQKGVGFSGGLGPLPVPLIQARQEFLESLHTTVFSVSLVVQARKVVEALEVSEPNLRPELVAPADSVALDAFVARHGDSWVSSVRLGGEVQGVYTFFAQTREEARAIEQSLAGVVALGGVRLGPELTRRLKEVTSSSEVNSSFRVRVRGLSSPPELGPEDLEAFVRGFAATPLDRPEILALETRGYEALPALGAVFAQVAANRTLFCGDAFKQGLLRQRERLRELVNQCRWVAGTYRVYGLTADPTLEAGLKRLAGDIEEIDALRRSFATSPSSPLDPPVLEALAAGSPRLQVVVSDGETMGGDGGTPFAFEGRQQAVQRRRRLVRIGLRSQARVDQIRLRYRQDSGGFNPVEDWEEVHGGEGGSDRGTVELADGVVIRRIEAKTGTRVDKLLLTTSDGQRLGGGGEKGNRPLDWAPPAGTVVLGFSGRSQAELDSLRPVIARFDPLSWEPVAENEDP